VPTHGLRAPIRFHKSHKNNYIKNFRIFAVVPDMLAWPLPYREDRSNKIRRSEPTKETRPWKRMRH
jgi:hypothetical protein